MSISEKLALIAENEQKVYDSGYAKGKSEGGSSNKLAQVIDRSVTEITAEDLAGATEIARYAFKEAKNLVGVTIPNSVTKINDYAFERCTNLINVSIPNSVTYIGESAFYKCTSLVGITIPDSVTDLINNAFNGCSSLAEVILSNNTKELRAGVFYDCKSLVGITIPNSVTRICTSALYGCASLTNITIPDSVTDMKDGYTFANCTNLESVWIGASVRQMPASTFSGCSNLKDIYVYFNEGDVANAPWGAEFAQIHYSPPFTFTIDGKEYTGTEKLTWEEWCNSEYNTGGFYIADNNYMYAPNGGDVYWYDGYFSAYGPQRTHNMRAYYREFHIREV